MLDEDLIELKFRLYDGSDLGPYRYSPTSTIAMVKEKILAVWPKDKKVVPKAANDIKLISAGKILENNKTVDQCRAPFGELPRGVITMHVVVQPTIAKAKTGCDFNDWGMTEWNEGRNCRLHNFIYFDNEKKVDETPRKPVCSCSIM